MNSTTHMKWCEPEPRRFRGRPRAACTTSCTFHASARGARLLVRPRLRGGPLAVRIQAACPGNPDVIDRRISLPPDSMLRPRNSLTVFEHLRSDVAPSGRPGLTPHGALLALGSIAAVRPDLAPEI